MDLAHIVYWEFDPTAQMYVFNDPFYAFYGTTAEQEGGYLVAREDYAKRFIHPDDIPLHYQFVKENTLRPDLEFSADIEHRIIRRDGVVRHIHARARVVKDDSGRVIKRYGANQDITERKQAEDRQKLFNKILEALNSPNDVVNLLKRILLLLKNHTGVEAISVRLREGEDYPYIETNGFSAHFIEKERYLCSRDEHNEIIRDAKGNPSLECMCGNIICRRTDPSLPFFTSGGSFWSNNTSKLLASTSEEDQQAHTRNRCSSEGYESVALIPLRSGEKIIGLLQLNDKRPDCFTLDMIEFLEKIAASIGIAVSRKQAREALKITEERYRSIFENALEGICRVTMDNRFVTANPSMARIFGYKSPEELMADVTNIGKQMYVNPEERAQYKKLLEEHGFVKNFEHRAYRKDGVIIWVSLTTHLIKDASGKVLYFDTMVEDITKRKEAEASLRASEGKYRNIFENAVEGIYQSAPEGRLISANPSMAHIQGYKSPEEMTANIIDIGKQLFVNSEDRIQYKSILEEHGIVNNFETQSPKKDGDIIWISLSARAVKDEDGKILYYEGIVEDITSRKMAEGILRQTMEKLRRSLVGTIQVMSMTTEIRDPYTAGHQKKVSKLARVIAQEMGLPNDTVENIRMAGSIHDIGKIAVPAEILSKPTKLTALEFSLIKVHSQSGYDILKDIGLPYPIAEIVFQHHERMDGSGYSQGLKNGQILLESQIIGVADVVEAISSHRPYRPAKGIDAALEEIEKNKGVFYDEKVVEVCIKLFREKGFSFGLTES